MNLSYRYTRSLVASGFSALFLFLASRFSIATHAAPQGITEITNGIPAILFTVAGTGFLIFAAIWAVLQS